MLVALTTCGVVFLTFDLAIGKTSRIVASIVAVLGYLVLWVAIPLRARPCDKQSPGSGEPSSDPRRRAAQHE